MKRMLCPAGRSCLLHRPFSTLRTRPILPAVLLAALLLSPGRAQSGSPAVNPGDIIQAAQRREEELRSIRDRKEEFDQAMDGLRERFVNEAWLDESAEKLKSLVFLPPLPPTLAQMEPAPAAPTYPVVLIEHAGETFFMAHGSLHFRRLLKPVHIRRIAAYRETRDRLLGELRQALAAAEKQPVADSTQALGELATRQETALQALENQAEKIRSELAELDDGAAVINLREKVTPVQPAALRDYFSAIHAAHFQDGFPIEQRQLLLAIAFDSLLGTPESDDSADFFLPATARVRWPADPTGTLAPLLSQFRSLRASLLGELREQVVQSTTSRDHAKQHATLAARQAPRIDELHRLAERLRIAAADLPAPDRPTPTDFPPELLRIVGQAVADKDAFPAEAKDLVAQLGREFAPLRFKLVFRDKLPVIEAQPAADHPVPPAVPTRLQQTNETLQRDYRELAAAMETARLALQRYRESLGADAPEAGKLSAQLAQTYAREETWRRFSDYRAAVLTPGLSPAQRRLLFNAALRDWEKHRLQATD